jgi:hypothetical protein
MGMDLIPNRKHIHGFQTNWSGWEALVHALKLLGADISSASFSNNGQRVLKSTALDWANKIELGVETNTLRQTNLTDLSDKDYTRYTLNPTADNLSEFDYNKLMEFVDFCRSSSGFRQY